MADLNIEAKTEIDPHADSVCCDGGGEFGHPKTYYSFDGKNSITCRYCNRIFVKYS